jgi:hypothetical protein
MSAPGVCPSAKPSVASTAELEVASAGNPAAANARALSQSQTLGRISACGPWCIARKPLRSRHRGPRGAARPGRPHGWYDPGCRALVVTASAFQALPTTTRLTSAASSSSPNTAPA